MNALSVVALLVFSAVAADYPMPQPEEQISAYRARLQKAGIKVTGESKKSGDGCSEESHSVIFPDADVEKVYAIGLKLIFRRADDYLSVLRKTGKPGKVIETVDSFATEVTRDSKGRVVKVDQTVPGEVEINTMVVVERDGSSGRIKAIKIDSDGGDGSWKGSVEPVDKGSTAVRFSSVQC